MKTRHVRKVKVQRRKTNFVVTIPSMIVKLLELKAGDTLEVYIDIDGEKIIYVKK